MSADIQHNLFAPTRCNPCLLPSPTPAEDATDEVKSNEVNSEPKKLLKCLGCKLIVYCSPEHQKIDWPIHRKFCNAVSQLLTKHKINTIFAIDGPIANKSELTKVKIKIKSKLATILKRKLHHHEEEMTSFPAMCEVCFSTKFNQLTQCKECEGVSYCCPEHEEEDAPNHRKDCLNLKLYYLKFKIEPSYELDSLEVKEKCTLADLDLSKLMSKMFGIEVIPNPSEALVEYQKFSFISNFSCIASVVYLVEIMIKTRPLRDDFTFYVVGATNDEIWFDKIHAEFFFARFPEVEELNIIFIGPDLADGKAILEPTTTTIAASGGRTFIKKSFRGNYEEYVREAKTYPDLIACFNCGFSEDASKSDRPADPWYYGIKSLIELPVPILFTSYTSVEAEKDLKAMEYVLEDRWKLLFSFEKMITRRVNPYRDLRPLRNWEGSDPETIFYRNGWIQAVRVYHNF